MTSVATIFEERPQGWGLRGDPFLWDDLEKHFTDISVPYAVDSFRAEFYDAFKKITGARFDSDDFIFVAKYDRGGMSSGSIAPEYWQNSALPLLIERLRALNTEVTGK